MEYILYDCVDSLCWLLFVIMLSKSVLNSKCDFFHFFLESFSINQNFLINILINNYWKRLSKTPEITRSNCYWGIPCTVLQYLMIMNDSGLHNYGILAKPNSLFSYSCNFWRTASFVHFLCIENVVKQAVAIVNNSKCYSTKNCHPFLISHKTEQNISCAIPSSQSACHCFHWK
jgi:hypothetical protein